MKKLFFSSKFALTIVFIIAVIVVLIGGAFLLGGKGFISIKNSQPKISETQCKYDDKYFCKFMESFVNSKSYSIKMTSMGHDGKSENLIELSGDGSTHKVVWVNGGETYNIISIGNTVYTKDYIDNMWLKQALTPAASEGALSKTTIDLKDVFDINVAAVISNGQYKKVGKEPCGELTCFKYELSNAEDERVRQFVWFDDSQYLIRKMRKEDPATTMDLEYSYNNINIKTPSLVKEL